MTSTSSVLVAVLAVSAAAHALLGAQDWPQWRGPSRTGAATAFEAPAAWPDRPRQVWKVSAGIGHASPIVVGARAYVFARVGEQEALTAVDLASGKQVWRQTYDAPYQVNPAAGGHGKGPKSTPVHDAGRIYTFGISGVLSAWQAADGKLVWRKDFRKDFPSTSPEFGTAMSPVVANNLVMVHAGGAGRGALMGLDVTTGDTKWSWRGDGPAYASPVVATLAGTRQVITQSQRHVVGLSLADGRLLWEIPFATEFEQNSVTPVVAHDLVIYSGLNKPTTAVRVLEAAGKWRTEQVWQNAAVPMYMSTPVEAGGYLFGLTHRSRGQFFCVEARTGKTMWVTKGREGENAALVLAGELLFALTTEGELIVARSSPKQFDIIKRYTVAESAVWAHPIPAGNGVLVKDVETLAYWVF